MSDSKYENDQAKLMKAVEDLVYLCSCVIRNETPDKSRIDGMNLDQLLRAAKWHRLSAMAASALESAGIYDKSFTEEKAKAVRLTALLDVEQARFLERFDQAGIWFMPLKGAILKDLYPEYGMRQMSDRDILFDSSRAEDVRDIMTEMGFESKGFGDSHHDYYLKPPCKFELHRSLINPAVDMKLYRYYSDVKNRLIKDEDNACGWHFRDEDFYLFMIAHEYEHYSISGSGVRSLLDTFVFLRDRELDWDYVKTEAERMGIDGFEQANRDLAVHLFGGQALSMEEQQMLEYMMASGVAGTEEQRQSRAMEKGRMHYFLSRLSLPLPVMQAVYPVLEKAPFLYPLFWAHRLVKAVLFRNKTVTEQLHLVLKGKNSPE